MNSNDNLCGVDKRYEGIDGLKAYAILGIALMHVLANGGYELGGFVFGRMIPAFTNLVFLFMMVSGFGMCCGYYQKIVDRKISMEKFYSKKYIKIWPYFALLCVLDFVISPSKNSLYEVFANLTLCQGLLPNAHIEVIGVSWTLAVIFVFYMLFPFFCFLLGNKKRAWGVATAALIFNLLCGSYFFDKNHIVDPASVGFSSRLNIVYDAIYFIAGGLIFLYRKELAEFGTEVQGSRRCDSAGSHSCVFCVRRFYTHAIVLLCGSFGLYPRMQPGEGTGQSNRKIHRCISRVPFVIIL